jgi:hypothetical protein
MAFCSNYVFLEFALLYPSYNNERVTHTGFSDAQPNIQPGEACTDYEMKCSPL